MDARNGISFSRIQMRFEFRTNYWKSQSNFPPLFFSFFFLVGPLPSKFFFSGNGFYFTRNRNRGPGSWIKGWIRRCLVIN